MKHLLLFSALACIFLFQNCAENVAFKMQEVELASVGAGIESQSFKVAFSKNSALDMVWVIDNSGSMSEESAHVRKNFQNFLTPLNQQTDFRLLVLSNQSNLGVTIPSQFSAATHRQVNMTVGSTNGPSLLLPVLENQVSSGFFRRNSQKVIVFVTDDESSLSSAKILSELESKLGWALNQVTVSSFIGLGSSLSRCQAKTGNVYMGLAQASGGKTYNICDADWSAQFKDLLDQSVTQAQRRFVLAKKTIDSVLEVRVDNQVISMSDVVFDGETISISDGVALSEASVVTVIYSLKKD
ncbi:hypothetical protein D3C87_253790 [compost metagenome]